MLPRILRTQYTQISDSPLFQCCGAKRKKVTCTAASYGEFIKYDYETFQIFIQTIYSWAPRPQSPQTLTFKAQLLWMYWIIINNGHLLYRVSQKKCPHFSTNFNKTGTFFLGHPV